jgi:integrase
MEVYYPPGPDIKCAIRPYSVRFFGSNTDAVGPLQDTLRRAISVTLLLPGQILMPRLTVKRVDAIRPTADRRELPDGYVRGLYLVVQPGTGSKSWAVRYRYAGKTRKHTIGNYPTFGLKDARDAAVKVLRSVSEGRDPVQQQRPGSVEDVVARFLDQHCKNYRPRTRKETARILRTKVPIEWRRRKIEEITRADIKGVLFALADTPVAANRTHSVLHTLFRFAVDNDLIVSSPIAGMRAPNKETPRDRVLTDAELRSVWRAANKIGFPFGSIVKLLILTGQRRGEVAGMAWPEIDNIGTGIWTLPKERVKNGRRHEVPLSPQAIAVLEHLPRIGEAAYVFTLNGAVPVRSFGKAKARLDRLAGIAPWTLHDLRRTAASGMAKLGVSLVVIEKVLNHVSGSLGCIVGVYQRHEYAEEKRAALQQWADHVEGLVG